MIIWILFGWLWTSHVCWCNRSCNPSSMFFFALILRFCWLITYVPANAFLSQCFLYNCIPIKSNVFAGWARICVFKYFCSSSFALLALHFTPACFTGWMQISKVMLFPHQPIWIPSQALIPVRRPVFGLRCYRLGSCGCRTVGFRNMLQELHEILWDPNIKCSQEIMVDVGGQSWQSALDLTCWSVALKFSKQTLDINPTMRSQPIGMFPETCDYG